MAKKDNRFIVLHKDSQFVGETKILVDRETGVNYLWHAEGYSGGLTVLLNADGTPVISQPGEWMDD